MLLSTHSNTLVLWRKSPAPSAKNGATCYPEASDWNYVNNIKEREKRCVFCMTSIYVVAFNRPLLSFPVRRQKIQIFASSTQPQGEVSQLSTQARQKWQLSCWGSSAQKKVALATNLSGSGGQKRGWQRRPFIMWHEESATKPKVYYGRHQIGLGQRETQWESPWWVKVNWRNAEIGQKSSDFQRM